MSSNSNSQLVDALHRAIVAGDFDAVKVILRQCGSRNRSAIVNSPNAQGQTALDLLLSLQYPQEHIDWRAVTQAVTQAMSEARGDPAALAAVMNIFPKNKKKDMCDALIAGGAVITTNAIIHETVHGSYLTLEPLLEKTTPAIVNGRNQNGWTALQLAVVNGSGYVTLSSLLNHGSNPNIADPHGKPVLHLAVEYDRGYTYISALLSKGADPNAVDRNQQTALHMAVLHNRGYAFVSSLTNAGGNVNARDCNGMTVLHHIMQMNNDDQSIIIEHLLQTRGCNANVQDNLGMSALHYHAKYGAFKPNEADPHAMIMAETRRRMNASHRQMQRQLDGQMRGIFQHAYEEEEEADMGDGTIVSALILAGSDVNLIDNNGSTPLFYAAETGNLEILVGLLHAGAKPNIQNQGRMFPLLLATKGDHTGIVEALLHAGSNVGTNDVLGNNCLHYTAINGSNDTLALLVHYGADLDGTNHNSET